MATLKNRSNHLLTLRMSRWLSLHLNTPLYKNSYLLIGNQGLSAVLGMVYWMVAARFFSAAEVGKSSAIISTLLFLSALTEFSMNPGMQRFVPRAGQRVRFLIVSSYAIMLAATAIVTVGFMTFGGYFHFSDNLFGGFSPITLALLVVATMFWTIFIVQDGILMGLRRTKWVLYENTFFNASKLVLLLIGITGLFKIGIVGSWFLPLPLAVFIVNGMIFARFVPAFLRLKRPPQEPLSGRQVIRSVGGDHIGTLLSETSIRILPLLVVNSLGAQANAYYYQAWLIGTMLYIITTNIASSFTVEAASNPGKIRQLSRKSLSHLLILLVPMILLLLAAAPYILRIYGPEYTRQGTALLRWLALAALPYGVNAWFLGYSRVRADIKSVILNQGLQLVIMLGLSTWWLRPYGITSLGLAWLITQLAITCVVALKSRHILFGSSLEGKEQTAAESGTAGIPATGMQEMIPTWVSGEDAKSPVYLFLSPHLDDAVLSCGGLIARLGAAGERVVVATIFTGDQGPGMPVFWLANRNQRAWRLLERPFAIRQHEDRRAVSALGAEAIHIGLLDGMYRGKMDPVSGRIQPFYPEDTVGVGVDPEDARIIGEQIKRALNQLFKMYCGDAGLRVFCPVGYSGHVDHQLVRKEAEAVFGMHSLVFYEEHPYATRQETDLKPEFLGQEDFPGNWNSRSLRLTHEEVERRISAAACYESQIPGLYPSTIERGLEIIAARIPSIGEAIWSMHWKGKDYRASRERMANAMRESIARFGGEKYWVLETQAEGEKQIELPGME